MDKKNNLRDLILTGGRARETGIQHYIEILSDPNSKLNLDMLDEIVTSLESLYIFNKNACSINNPNKSEYDSAQIQCNNDDKYINLFNDLYQNAKSKWKTSNCYKNQYGQCINFNELISHWAPKLYDAYRNTNQNGSSNIKFLYENYTNKYYPKNRV
jgi:hypothetical protein